MTFRRRAAGVALLLAGCSQPSLAGAADAPASDDIVVTGQAPPGAVIGDIPAENQLNRADIDGYGVSTVSELLDEIAGQTSSNQGRSDDGPVVLVNGKRISGVNEVNDLPTESILRLDILPEEVALKYGYDAQKKVVNIILHRRFQSRTASLSGGAATQDLGRGQGENLSGDGSYTRIRDNDRINIAARVKTAAALMESDRDVTLDTDAAGDDRAYRTLSPATRTYMLNANVAHQLTDKATLSWNGRASYATSEALNGLASGALTDADGESVERILSNDALRQNSRTLSLSTGLSLNVDLSKVWRLSVIGSYSHNDERTDSDRGYDLTALQSAIDAGAASVDGTLPASLLGAMQTDRARAVSNSGSASLLVNGRLFRLPAGPIGMSVRLSGDTSALRSSSTTDGLTTARTAQRTNGGAQISFDLPIASRRNHILSPLGTLTANVNASVTQVSDYGALGTFGYGLNWTPRTGISIIAAVNNDRTAPTLEQRNSPMVTTGNVRLYDYVRGETAIVTQVSGGNPDLKADNRHVFKLGATIKPLSKLNLTLSANYANSHTRNAIISLSGASEALEDAFPDRYERDADGALTWIDTRSINVARADKEQLRWGINFTQILRAPKRPAPPAGAHTPPAGWPATGRQDGVPKDGAAQADGTAKETEETRNDAGPGGENDILVTGRKQDDAMPMSPGGFGPDGFGPPDGPPPDGPPPGGPPPGAGGPGGFEPPPGGGPGGGSDNGARLQLSLYHSILLRNAVLLREGSSWIDLLDGGTLGGSAQSRHMVQLSSGVTDNGVGLRVESNWKSAAHVTTSDGDLRFGALTTFDLRLFANLSNRFRGKNWARGTRVSLSVENIFNRRQAVTDSDGDTPLAYQPAYLDPEGRTVKLSVRRIF
ncbi:TonB-dependent receptor [Sphingobium sp. CAP-1]|nr:TonB-dependent receptor [Sphingobium sp. CAP-1]